MFNDKTHGRIRFSRMRAQFDAGQNDPKWGAGAGGWPRAPRLLQPVAPNLEGTWRKWRPSSGTGKAMRMSGPGRGSPGGVSPSEIALGWTSFRVPSAPIHGPRGTSDERAARGRFVHGVRGASPRGPIVSRIFFFSAWISWVFEAAAQRRQKRTEGALCRLPATRWGVIIIVSLWRGQLTRAVPPLLASGASRGHRDGFWRT